jgi:hypothetical protein
MGRLEYQYHTQCYFANNAKRRQEMAKDPERNLSRRLALSKMGIFAAAAYSVPLITTASMAHASGGSAASGGSGGNSGASGGGNSGPSETSEPSVASSASVASTASEPSAPEECDVEDISANCS